ncbi:HNH endonuclease family protein [Salegentibacter mishustinae]|nr:HNH endonuclease family protein [Salegentibacter mishustinae]
MERLETEQDRNLFSKVWDSCSDMNKYLQLSLVKTNKDIEKVFGENWNELPSKYEELFDKYADFQEELDSEKKNKEKKDDLSLEELLKAKVAVDPEKSKNQEEWSSLTSVINFPNFLLQVLSVFCPETDIALDDKRLLEQFEPFYSGKMDKFPLPEVFVKEFCYALFKSKFLFDKYIIRNREENNETEWLLREIRPYSKGYNWVETFGANKNDNIQENIIMLQSMFHVSFPTRNYKNWFTAVLNYLYKNENRGKIKGDEFKTHLMKMSDSFYFDRDGAEPLPYRKIIFENNCEAEKDSVNEESFIMGVDTKNFVFNRLDYKLWEKRDELTWPENSIKIINNFKFTFRSSVEHFYPRNPNTGLKATYNVDKFGNLCLIDRGKNSQLSNNEPLAKVSFYKNTSNVDSLKLHLMMADADKWAEEKIVECHENAMKEMLNSPSV